jgi:hypothetical protein
VRSDNLREGVVSLPQDASVYFDIISSKFECDLHIFDYSLTIIFAEGFNMVRFFPVINRKRPTKRP